MKNTKTNTEKTIVAFHIGRGGRFNNSGYLRYLGEKQIGEFIGDLFLQENGEYHDEMGRYVCLDQDNVDSGIGIINIDHDYDTTYTKLYEDCNDEELDLIDKYN